MIQSIPYTGKILSLNDYAGGKHWRVKSQKISELKSYFQLKAIELKIKPVETFRVIVEYNSRHDVDNVITIEKVLVDSLKGTIIKDDSTKYFKGLSIFYNNELPKNTFIFHIESDDKKRNSRPTKGSNKA